jgi:hypothetical protein
LRYIQEPFTYSGTAVNFSTAEILKSRRYFSFSELPAAVSLEEKFEKMI